MADCLPWTLKMSINCFAFASNQSIHCLPCTPGNAFSAAKCWNLRPWMCASLPRSWQSTGSRATWSASIQSLWMWANEKLAISIPTNAKPLPPSNHWMSSPSSTLVPYSQKQVAVYELIIRCTWQSFGESDYYNCSFWITWFRRVAMVNGRDKVCAVLKPPEKLNISARTWK